MPTSPTNPLTNAEPTPGPWFLDSTDEDIAAGRDIEIYGGIPYYDGPGGGRAIGVICNADTFENIDYDDTERRAQAIAESVANSRLVIASPYLYAAARAEAKLREHAGMCRCCRGQGAYDNFACALWSALAAARTYLNVYALGIIRGDIDPQEREKEHQGDLARLYAEVEEQIDRAISAAEEMGVRADG